MKVLTGLQRLIEEKDLSKRFTGNIGLLCHSASISHDYEHALIAFKKLFGDQLKKIFGPQHGFVTDVQDNMIETNHYIHPYFKLPIYSLYSETRSPTDEMLEGLDHIFVDLQDVGTRIYTYIYTMTLLLEACAKKGIEVIILDRPNPVNAETIEGNVLDLQFSSFVGRHPLPVRHALTIGEVALMHQKYWVSSQQALKLTVIEMKGYKRWMSFEDTNLPWVLPSPNLPNPESAYTFIGTVLFEGTNISEGRGTTKSLEIFGHPKIEPFSYAKHLQDSLSKVNLLGFTLRPLVFLPMFQKHAHHPCGGFQIHVIDRSLFSPWKTCQFITKNLFHDLGESFEWKKPPYEYEYHKHPVDLINGTDRLRLWVEKNGDLEEYDEISMTGKDIYLEHRKEILLYY